MPVTFSGGRDSGSADNATGPVADPSYRRVRVARLFLATLAWITSVFGIANLFWFQLHTLAYIELFIAGTMIYALYDLHRSGNSRTAVIVAIAGSSAIAVVFYWLIAAQYSAAVWIMLFPVFAFFLLGTRAGLLTYLVYAMVILAVMVSHIGEWPALDQPETLANTVGAMVAFGVVAYYYERTREEAYERITQLANRDGLTGIANRRHFLENGAKVERRAQSGECTYGLVLLDIDNFKAINDTYGHLVGDRVIAEVVARVAENIREVDLIGRLGGEEFGALLVGCDHADAVARAEQIRRRVATRPVWLDGVGIPVTVSLGVASNDVDAGDFHSLFSAADRRLYDAKETGRDRVSHRGTVRPATSD